MDVLILMKVFTLLPKVEKQFPDNTKRKNIFLSTCKILDESIDLQTFDQKYPFGGLIGYGNSYMDPILQHSKLFRMHAILHDAAGSVKQTTGNGPGYCYILSQFPSSCLLGHISGLLFCLYIKFIIPKLFNHFDC